MKTKLQFVAVLVLGLCGTTPCFTHYNPSTGRWLSRDPIEERGGVNVYAFVRNAALSSCDYLGLFRDDWMEYSSCPCKCDSVTVTYDPGGDRLQLGGFQDYVLGIPWGHHYGNRIHVSWKVSGTPWRCRYYQDEGNLTMKVTGPGQDGTPLVFRKENPVSQIYSDEMGIHFPPLGDLNPNLTGDYEIIVHWDVTFRCVSQNGEPVVRRRDQV